MTEKTPAPESKKFRKFRFLSFETQILIVLLVASAFVLMAGWGFAMNLRQTVADNAALMNVDADAGVEVEQLRNIAESQISTSRAYFLLGSKSLFDKQKSDKEAFAAGLAKFEKQRGLPQISEIAKKLQALQQQEQEFFDQGMDYRSKNEESKIVGQFYQSKTAPILTALNENLSKLTQVHNEDLAKAKDRARKAGLDAQALIPQGMSVFTAAIAGLTVCFALLVLRMLRVRVVLKRQQGRLVDEAKSAVLARDEVISAVTQDLKAPIAELNDIADQLTTAQDASQIKDEAALIKAMASEMQSILDDIYDQKMADMNGLTLRLEQLAVADIFDEAQTVLQPLAKQKDITLQFDAVNQSILAYVDRERVMRVLSNLIGNAIKFSPKHTRVQVKVKSDAQFVNVHVLDSGSGIPEAQMDGLFDNFWQARKTADQGAGVGLAVVKTIIEAHGGTVRAEKNINGGTTVIFSLSRRRPANAQLKKPSASGVRRVARLEPRMESPEGPTV